MSETNFGIKYPFTNADIVKGSGYIAAFRPDRITAELGGCKNRINALIGVDKDVFEGEGFDAILNPKILI